MVFTALISRDAGCTIPTGDCCANNALNRVGPVFSCSKFAGPLNRERIRVGDLRSDQRTILMGKGTCSIK